MLKMKLMFSLSSFVWFVCFVVKNFLPIASGHVAIWRMDLLLCKNAGRVHFMSQQRGFAMKALKSVDHKEAMALHARYFEDFLPKLRDQLLIEDLKNLSCRFSYRLTDSNTPPWHLEIEQGRLVHVGQENEESECCFVCDVETLLRVVSAKLSPQDAFFDLRVEMEGDIELGLKLSTVLAPFFERYPFQTW